MGDAATPLEPKETRKDAFTLAMWKKGQSGNPTGKNGITGLMAKLRGVSQDGDRLIQVLEEALASPNWAVKLKAVEIWFDRAYGKAFQPFAGDSEGRPMMDLTKLSQSEVETFIKLCAKSAHDRPSDPQTT